MKKNKEAGFEILSTQRDSTIISLGTAKRKLSEDVSALQNQWYDGNAEKTGLQDELTSLMGEQEVERSKQAKEMDALKRKSTTTQRGRSRITATLTATLTAEKYATEIGKIGRRTEDLEQKLKAADKEMKSLDAGRSRTGEDFGVEVVSSARSRKRSVVRVYMRCSAAPKSSPVLPASRPLDLLVYCFRNTSAVRGTYWP